MQIVGESVKQRRGDELPRESGIFDGHAVSLRAARGEIVDVQVLRRDEGDAPMSLAIDGLLVQAWRVDDVHVARPSTEMYGPSRGAGDYADVLVAGTRGEVTAGRDALFDVGVLRDAAPGVHAGELRIGAERVPVTVTVEPIDMPSIGDAPRVWAYYNAGELARGDGVTGDDAWADEQRTAAMFRDFGVLATPELTLDDAAKRAEAVRGARFVPVLLPSAQEDIERDARAWAAWAKASGQQPFAIPIDEPATIAAKLQARAIGTWLHAAGGGVWLAVTDAPEWIYGDAIDVFVSPAAPGTGPPDRRWTYNGAPPRAGAMIADTDGVALRTWGWIGFVHDVPFWYVWDAAYWRDRHNARRRGIAREAVPAFDPKTDAVTFDDGDDRGNLDGVLFYPGGAPSLRMVALRRGLEDRALLDALAACAGRAKAVAIATKLVPRSLGDAVASGEAGSWPTDEAPWEAARREVLDGLLACAARH